MATVMLPATRAPAAAGQQRSSSSSRPKFGSAFLRGDKQQFAGGAGLQVAARSSSGAGDSQRRVTVMAAKGEARGGPGKVGEGNAAGAVVRLGGARAMHAREPLLGAP